MEFLILVVGVAALYFYSQYEKEKAARLAEQYRREDEEYGRMVGEMLAQQVKKDIESGMTPEESADKNAQLYGTLLKKADS